MGCGRGACPHPQSRRVTEIVHCYIEIGIVQNMQNYLDMKEYELYFLVYKAINVSATEAKSTGKAI